MPLSTPVSRRALRHTRAIDVQAFARDDGLWDIDAHLSDTKTGDAQLASGLRPAGAPIHDLRLRLTVDRALTIVEAEAASDAVPYPGFCDTVVPAYQALLGLNLLRHFRQELKLRLAGRAGCTHLSELAQVLPTAAIQSLGGAGLLGRPGADRAPSGEQGQAPFQINRCHALRADGAAVALYYPRWAVKAAPA